MEKEPLVSVIIPCYNVSNYIAQALMSIINQTYTNLEILVVDDASTDNTLEVVKEIIDDRVKIIEYKENTKKIGAVNSVLNLAKGSLITFQDADDWSEPGRIVAQVNAFNNNPSLGICFTRYRNIGEKVSEPKFVALTNAELQCEFLKFGLNKCSNLEATCCPSMMIKSEIINTIGGYNSYFKGRVAEDIHWIYRILKKYPGQTINARLYNYRIREGSLTQDQLAGKNAKAAYTWQLLSKIIAADIVEDKDLLNPEYAQELCKIELEACEEALVECIQAQKKLKENYENSKTFKLGKFILKPWQLFFKRL